MPAPIATEGLGYGWAAFLGLIQGFTEFLPVSSSGHLALAGLLGRGVPQSQSFDILLHLATVLAILVGFGKDLLRYWKEERIIIVYLLVGSIPAGLGGVFFLSSIKMLRLEPLAICSALLITGITLFWAEYKEYPTVPMNKMGYGTCLLIGMCQALGLMPGISRSGLTITGGLIGGISREDAVRFSFLLGVPAILGAAFLTAVKERNNLGELLSFPHLLGFVVAAVSGIFALKLIVIIVKNRNLRYFAIYCASAGIIGLLYFGLIKK